jgi:hypothetical protein
VRGTISLLEKGGDFLFISPTLSKKLTSAYKQNRSWRRGHSNLIGSYVVIEELLHFRIRYEENLQVPRELERGIFFSRGGLSSFRIVSKKIHSSSLLIYLLNHSWE